MRAVAEKPSTEVRLNSFVMGCDRGGAEIIDQRAEEWRLLCAEAAEDQPFFRPEWIRAYVREYGRNCRIWLITARQDGRLCLLLPLLQQIATFSKIPVRRLRSPVNANCGRFDAVRRAGPLGEAAIRATWNYLRGLDGWDLIEFRNALEGSTVSQIAAIAQATGFPSIQRPDKANPFVVVPSNTELLKQMPPNAKLRSQLRQARLRLEELGEVKFYRVGTADPEALERFYKLEASGWKGQIRSCVLYDGSRDFYDEVASSAARFGYFCLYMLESNGHLIAAHFSFNHRGRCYSPKVAIDETFKRYAPGHLIMSEILLDCVARGIDVYDITGEDHPWKMKWTSRTRAVNDHYIFKGPIGRLAYVVGDRLRFSLDRSLPGRRQPSKGQIESGCGIFQEQ